MRILGLPGRDDATGPWMDEILAGIRDASDETRTQYYEFWSTPDAQPDAQREIARACEFGPDMICAKSMGTILTLTAVGNGVLHPKACVLIGIPVGGLRERAAELLTAWQKRAIPTLFIQQTADRTGSFEELSNLVTASDTCSLVEVAGSDHMYTDVAELVGHIGKWRAAGQ